MTTMKNDYYDIYFVRHGETSWNAEGRLQGLSDIPLNVKGLEQALELQKSLSSIPFSAAFCSTLLRAKKTAELIIEPKQIPLIEKVELRERYAGPFEGKLVSDLDAYLRQNYPLWPTFEKEAYLCYQWHPEIETWRAVYQRIEQFLYSLLPSFSNTSLLAVSHSGVIRAILDHLDFLPGYRWTIGNCGFIHMRVSFQSLSLIQTHNVTRKVLL
jgi:broad specificity phosphatase PhoE